MERGQDIAEVPAGLVDELLGSRGHSGFALTVERPDEHVGGVTESLPGLSVQPLRQPRREQGGIGTLFPFQQDQQGLMAQPMPFPDLVELVQSCGVPPGCAAGEKRPPNEQGALPSGSAAALNDSVKSSRNFLIYNIEM